MHRKDDFSSISLVALLEMIKYRRQLSVHNKDNSALLPWREIVKFREDYEHDMIVLGKLQTENKDLNDEIEMYKGSIQSKDLEIKNLKNEIELLNFGSQIILYRLYCIANICE